ncbi:MAG: response regulator, partial [Gammaproteobacteria bacterium]|nr:response regulator [Gammaproteobacteria bacterium]
KDELAVAASENNLKISFVETKLWVDSDYRIVERIMRNFISNAIKYTHDGGIVVGCRRIEGRLMLAVYDTGIGINKSDIQVVFDEFHQLHNPERDRSKGLGLGLAIVKRMAKLINMPLWTKSVQGVGSSFGLIMPCYKNTSPQVQHTETATSKDVFDGVRVLVVDDEEAVRESLTELLRSWHCEVIATASGAEAVQMIENVSVRPDIILADYRLRDNETGIDVVQRINSLYSGSEIPGIIITGDTAPDRIKEVEASGYKILNKPVSPVVLRALLAEF